MLGPDDNNNNNNNSTSCFFDFSLFIDDHIPLDSDFPWFSNDNPFTGSSNLRSVLRNKYIYFVHYSNNLLVYDTCSTGLLDSSCCKELGSRKRVNSASCSATDSKACREKKRRDKINKKFQELNEILDPGRPPMTDKTVILGDAIRRVIQLREEAMKLKESTQDLQTKINELKVEKSELRDEKQKLKAEKERLELQVKAFSRLPATSAFFPYPQSPIVDGKFVPVMGYHGVPMWPFASVPAVDTSEDHILRSPLA
ncbi:transcription factor bHLH115-like [Bidens hawaiensis]|uniref:transcription factor bHLH115-like n=1 Tax=Bidens hawaiensis TaxID=980011 RepID=UPI00404B469A